MAALPAVAGALLALRSIALPDTGIVEEAAFGRFMDAVAITADVRGRMIVVDAGAEKVCVFTGPSATSDCVGGFGLGAGSFDRPSGAASDGVNLYVADRGNHRIQRFDRSLAWISSLTTRDTSETTARFGSPLGIALTGFGDLLVLDGENRRLVQFRAGTQYDAAFAPALASRPPLEDPVKILALPDGRIVLGEHSRITLMDQFGSALRIFIHPWLGGLRGLTADQDGTIAVTDSGLVWFSYDGGCVTTIANAQILTEGRAQAFRDAAWSGGRLFLLTPTTVLRCTVR